MDVNIHAVNKVTLSEIQELGDEPHKFFTRDFNVSVGDNVILSLTLFSNDKETLVVKVTEEKTV